MKVYPSPPIMYCLSDIPASRSDTAQAQKNIAAFADVGVNYIGADTGLHLGWRKNEPFDCEPLKEELTGVLDANPKAKIFLRLHVNPPYWWIRDHTEEQIVYRTADGDVYGEDHGESDRLIRGDNLRHMRFSLASELWRKEAGERLADFCASLSGTPEGDALAGIQIASGLYGEWADFGMDVSPVARSRFKKFLIEKYRDEDSLRAAWHSDRVTFETAEYHPEGGAGDDGFFRDPRASQASVDSQYCHGLIIAEAILYFCRIVKTRMPNCLAGSFTGNYFGAAKLNSAHLMISLFRRAHEEGCFDYHCGPFCYLKNRTAQGIPLQRALLESSRLHNMLYLTEMDQHPAGTEEFAGGDPAKFDETVAMLRRNAFQPLLAGEGFWYYDHRIIPSLISPDSHNSSAGSVYRKRGWWETAPLMAEIKRIQDVARRYCSADPADKGTEADVLLVWDTVSCYWHETFPEREYEIHEAVMRAGAVYDSVYADDLPLVELKRYKCVVMVNIFTLSEKRRATILSLLRGKKVVWLYAAGFCDGETLSEENISATVGMKIRRVTGRTGFTFGGETVSFSENAYRPQFAADSGDGVFPLAYYNGGGIAAARRGDNLWLSTMHITRSIMRQIFTDAGVHLWTDSGDPVMAGCGLALINTPAGGERVISLPDGRELREVREKLPPMTTAIYDMKTLKRIL